MFKDKLKESMERERITAAELSRRTGISQACISTYLSGRSEPRDKSKKLLEEALQIRAEDKEEQTDAFTTTLTEVAKVMHCSLDVIKAGLQQGIFPWGYAIQLGVGSDGRTNWAYKVNRIRFFEIEHVEI